MTDEPQDLSVEAFSRLYPEPRHPAIQNAREVIQAEDHLVRIAQPVREEMNRLWRALMLATDAETLESLLAGDKVPISRLDPEWLRRFNRR